MTQHENLETAHPALSADAAGEDSPSGEMEVTVARLFAEMLGISILPRRASLFDLGLDSVAVTIACARLEQVTGVQVRFTQLFRTPSVAELAAQIDSARAEDDERPAATTPTSDADELVSITPMQTESVPLGIVVELAWWFGGEIDDAALDGAATDVHRRHQALHARYLSGAHRGLAEVPADPGRAEFHWLGRQDSDATASEALRGTLRQPLRLGEGQVWRCAIVRSQESGRTLFGLAVDHAGFDGRSWDVLTTELPMAQAARVAGASPQWPGRVASLAEMAADFRQQLLSAGIDAQRRYWREEFHEVPSCRLSPVGEGVVALPPIPEGSRYSAMGPATTRSQVIDRTMTNRVGNFLLRPNGPSRSGPHILERTRASHHQAMAARGVLMDPIKLCNVLGGEGSDGIIHLDRMAALNYNTIPELTLGRVAGTLASELWDPPKCNFPVILQVLPVPEGLIMNLLVRTDKSEVDVADRLSDQLLAVIDGGPERLEQQTAS